jgi:hypothetical protein
MPLRINARLTHAHWWKLWFFSRQYREKLMPSLLASSKWARHARSRSLKPSRFRSDIALSTSAATAPRWKASPRQIKTESTGLLECLLSCGVRLEWKFFEPLPNGKILIPDFS